MSRKMIFFDIDGTLVTENTNIIPEGTIKAIRKARNNGHMVFVNTGRTFFEVTENIRSIGFDGYVCGCGTYIYYDGKPLLAKSISHETCAEIVGKLRECRIDAFLEGVNNIYFEQTKPVKGEVAKLKAQLSMQGIDVARSWDDPDIVFDKFVMWADENSDFETFHSYITKDFQYIVRGENFGEVIPNGYSKATGIRFLQDYFNIPLENCYAIGDSTNDLPMLKYVPHSIAMGNSTPSLFNLVSYVTKSIEDDGIKHALLHYNII